MIHRDSQDVVIREGMRVAYNLSGDVVPGIVVDVSCNSHIKVRYEGNSPMWRKHVSRVRNGRSMLVLAGIAIMSHKTSSNLWSLD